MPTYLFRCTSCETEFSVETPWSKKGDVNCPDCKGSGLKELFGRYTLNVIGGDGGSNGGNDPACGCGNPAGG